MINRILNRPTSLDGNNNNNSSRKPNNRSGTVLLGINTNSYNDYNSGTSNNSNNINIDHAMSTKKPNNVVIRPSRPAPTIPQVTSPILQTSSSSPPLENQIPSPISSNSLGQQKDGSFYSISSKNNSNNSSGSNSSNNISYGDSSKNWTEYNSNQGLQRDDLLSSDQEDAFFTQSNMNDLSSKNWDESTANNDENRIPFSSGLYQRTNIASKETSDDNNESGSYSPNAEEFQKDDDNNGKSFVDPKNDDNWKTSNKHKNKNKAVKNKEMKPEEEQQLVYSCYFDLID